MIALRNAALGLATSLVLGVGGGFAAYHALERALEAQRLALPPVDPPGTYRPPLKTQILAADGTVLTEIYRENRELLRLEEMPRDLLDATVASEDRWFYTHPGISPRGVARATVANLRSGGIEEGASTISMQLARELYLNREQTWRRKVREAMLAVKLEELYSKDELLELYLNQINYGRGAYGVRTAARMYFGKVPADLTLSEIAALAAVPQRPADYHLYTDRAGALRRRDRVLAEMLAEGYITRAEHDSARAERLVVQPYHPPEVRFERAPYYVSWALREACELLGDEYVYRGGLRIHTAVDLKLQDTADQAVRTLLGRAGRVGGTDAAAVLLDPFTGRILALSGGIDWERSQFNHATQARRQPGSAFKPFVYTAALDRGYSPDERILDAPFTWQEPFSAPWRPRNYDGVYRGQVTLQTALNLSINVAAARLTQRLGVTTVIAYAKRMGIRSPLSAVPSLALGTSEVTPLELTAAYGVFPAGGLYVEPSTIVRVEDLDGRLVYQREPRRDVAISPRVAFDMVTMLRGVMTSGTGRPAAFAGPCGGKTGTTQNNRDAWFVGFTPHYVCGVWLGNNRGGRMHGVYGGTFCGPAWRTIVQAALRGDGGAGEFAYPDWLGPNAPEAADLMGRGIVIRGRVEKPTVGAEKQPGDSAVDEALRRADRERAEAGLPPLPYASGRPESFYQEGSAPGSVPPPPLRPPVGRLQPEPAPPAPLPEPAPPATGDRPEPEPAAP